MAGRSNTKTAPPQPRTRRGFGRLRRLPSDRYQASYLHHGVIHKALATFPNKDSAIAWLNDEEHLINLDRRTPGTWTAPGARAAKAAAAKLTLREYAQRWLAQRPLAPATHRSYEQALRRSILPVLGERALSEITPEDVRIWFAGLDPQYVTRNARAYGVLTAILNTAADDDLIDRSPARIKGGTAVRHAKRSVVLLTPAELGALAGKMPEPLALSVLLAGWCGLRRGEVFALTRADVAADGSTVRINKAVDTYGTRLTVGPTKTGESRRTVTVPTHIRPTVVAHLHAHVGKPRSALLFVDPDRGGHVSEGRYRPYFFAAREAIGQPELHFHDLRHFGGVMAAVAGGTVKEVMDRLGHTTSSAAMRYQHVAAGRADLLAQRLSALAASTTETR